MGRGIALIRRYAKERPVSESNQRLNSTSNTIVLHSQSLFILGLNRLPALGLSDGGMFEADVLVYL
jgi:hypothetical protein